MRIVTSSVNAIAGNNAKPNNENGGAKIPRGLRGLPITSLAGSTNARSELGALQDEAASIEQWWANPRWQHTKRVYSGKKALLWSCRRDAVMLCRYCASDVVISLSLLFSHGRGLPSPLGRSPRRHRWSPRAQHELFQSAILETVRPLDQVARRGWILAHLWGSGPRPGRANGPALVVGLCVGMAVLVDGVVDQRAGTGCEWNSC